MEPKYLLTPASSHPTPEPQFPNTQRQVYMGKCVTVGAMEDHVTNLCCVKLGWGSDCVWQYWRRAGVLTHGPGFLCVLSCWASPSMLALGKKQKN